MTGTLWQVRCFRTGKDPETLLSSGRKVTSGDKCLFLAARNLSGEEKRALSYDRTLRCWARVPSRVIGGKNGVKGQLKTTSGRKSAPKTREKRTGAFPTLKKTSTKLPGGPDSHCQGRPLLVQNKDTSVSPPGKGQKVRRGGGTRPIYHRCVSLPGLLGEGKMRKIQGSS